MAYKIDHGGKTLGGTIDTSDQRYRADGDYRIDSGEPDARAKMVQDSARAWKDNPGIQADPLTTDAREAPPTTAKTDAREQMIAREQQQYKRSAGA